MNQVKDLTQLKVTDLWKEVRTTELSRLSSCPQSRDQDYRFDRGLSVRSDGELVLSVVLPMEQVSTGSSMELSTI
jgi:hypothetical protein